MDTNSVDYVLSYNNNSSELTPYFAPPGTKIQYRKTRPAKSVYSPLVGWISKVALNAKIVEYDEQRPEWVKVQRWEYSWGLPIKSGYRWIKKSSILMILK